MELNALQCSHSKKKAKFFTSWHRSPHLKHSSARLETVRNSSQFFQVLRNRFEAIKNWTNTKRLGKRWLSKQFFTELPLTNLKGSPQPLVILLLWEVPTSACLPLSPSPCREFDRTKIDHQSTPLGAASWTAPEHLITDVNYSWLLEQSAARSHLNHITIRPNSSYWSSSFNAALARSILLNNERCTIY